MYDKKMAMIYIIDILKEYSDKNHSLTQQEIINKLHDIYLIDVERRTISTTIDLLVEYGYDIVKIPSGGYYLNERHFDENEIKFLIDAVYSSKSISGSQAKTISKKLYSMLSRYEQKDYSYLYKSTEINRSTNKELFLNIELINDAIKENKKISFKYLIYDEEGNIKEKRNGHRYIVSPYFLVNNFNKYYLICNINFFDNHAYYRIEYMKDINILDEVAKPYKEVPTLGEKFDISKHINDHIYMFGGDIIHATVELISKSASTYVMDWFGHNARIYKDNDKYYASIKSNDKAFYFWALQYQEHIKIISPEYIVDKFVKTLEETIKNYKQ
jgi:predicted DNA-binding transcriptional regulator YafY